MRNCVQWTLVYESVNPSDAVASSTTGFCMLPISLDKSYVCEVFANYYNNWWATSDFSTAVQQKRHANFILDSHPCCIGRNNGFNYELDFSPTVTNVGFGYYAMIVCIKYK